MNKSDSDTLKRDLQKAVDLMNSGNWAEAASSMSALQGRYPTNAYVLFNLGVTQWHLGSHLAAIQSYRRSLGADPMFLPAMVNLSNALHALGDFREALRYAQMAVHRQPGNAILLSNLANILSALGEHEDAVGALRDALRNDPKFTKARAILVSALDELGKWDESLAEAELIIDDPDVNIRIPALFAAAGIARRTSRWDLCDLYIPRLLDDIRNPKAPPLNPMAFAFFTDDPDLMYRMAKSSDSPSMPSTNRAAHRRDGRITVAYLSPDFRDHPVSHMLYDVLRAHDRSRFKIVAASIIPMDESLESAAIRNAVDEVLDLSQLDDSQALHALHQAGVDIIVDIAGTTKWHRSTLLARRPCALQFLWLGCPCSTGAKHYDGIIVDSVVAPNGYEAYCSEPVIRLPGCYHPISNGIISKGSAIQRSDVGLPNDALVVAMLQQPAKIRPPLVDKIAKIVASNPYTHFWLRVHQDAVQSAAQRLEAIGLPQDRLHFIQRFVNRSDFLAAHRLADIVVDSYPYGGHSTTGEALMQGTPVLTFYGKTIHTRVAASMLTELGLADCIQPSLESMIETLDRLCKNNEELTQWKSRFASATKNYETNGIQRLTRSLENLFADRLQNK